MSAALTATEATTAVAEVLAFAGTAVASGVTLFWLFGWPEQRWVGRLVTTARTGWIVALLASLGAGAALLSGPVRGGSGWSHPGLVGASADGTSLLARLSLLCVALAWLGEARETYGAARYRTMHPAKGALGIGALALLPWTFVSAVPLGASTRVVGVLAAGIALPAAVALLGVLTLLAVLVVGHETDALQTVRRRATLVCVVAALIDLAALALVASVGPLPLGAWVAFGVVAAASVAVLGAAFAATRSTQVDPANPVPSASDQAGTPVAATTPRPIAPQDSPSGESRNLACPTT